MNKYDLQAEASMKTAIYWFRSDLRLRDNPAFELACKASDFLLPIYIHPAYFDEQTAWGFPRLAKHRKVFLEESLSDLRAQLRGRGSELLEISGSVLEVFQDLRSQLNVNRVYCEQIEAPEELGQVALLRNAGFNLKLIWQSSMLDPQAMPFKPEDMPDVFTQFRQQIEKHQFRFAIPINTPTRIPPLPGNSKDLGRVTGMDRVTGHGLFLGGESKAFLHLEQYFNRRLPDTYKQTRNQLIGMDYSSKFSPWLAPGCISARVIAKELSDYESAHGANDGTYWLWFELLWRDYFRFLHMKYGNQLYQSRGLSGEPSNPFIKTKFDQWRSGDTGQSLVDAGMQELQATGYLSNRMRQIVASYWIFDMKGDWQAGAAWFESQLIDYDVYSNQGNWLYIAGKGTDPRGGRPMNLAKQTQDHDPDGVYRKIWLS